MSTSSATSASCSGSQAKVNGGETAIRGKLTANIDLTGIENWTLMGSRKQPFTGSFDGDGHSITGMSITFNSDDKSVGAPYLGLFGYVKGTADKKAEIKNLKLSGKLDITENYRNSFAYSGGLVGGAEYVSFTDVTVDVAVTAKQGTAPYAWSYIGGFAGTVVNADFLRCVNNGTVTSDGDYVSGFVPKSEKTTYTACANNGAITGRTKVGGIGADVQVHQGNGLRQYRSHQPCGIWYRQSGNRRSLCQNLLRLRPHPLL